MGKKNKHNNATAGKEFMEFIQNKNFTLEQIQDILEEFKTSKTVDCSHTNSEGKPRIEPIDDSGYLYKCKKCGAVIDLRPIDLDKAKKAVETVNNMINQVKLFTADPTEDQRSIREMGRSSQNIFRVLKVYDTVAPGKKFKKNKKKNKHNNRNDFIGGYGIYNLDNSKKRK